MVPENDSVKPARAGSAFRATSTKASSRCPG